jgi:heme/copper-type cytochrome/quinol oxidase subunit 3
MPYTVKNHPVTGVYSGKLGIWLFLASEVMLFGALFSTYVLLRVTAPELGETKWPVGHEETHLSVRIGTANTFILITSSVTMVLCWAALKKGDFAKGRALLFLTGVLGAVFLVIKLAFEYIPKIQHGYLPSSSTFYSIYYTITGLHGLHVLCGVVVLFYFAGPGSKLWHRDPEYYTNRVECTGLYWHFVDLVWIFVFPLLYLL